MWQVVGMQTWINPWSQEVRYPMSFKSPQWPVKGHVGDNTQLTILYYIEGSTSPVT